MTPLVIPVLLLAAGHSSRMRGRDKLLEPVDRDIPLLADRVDAALGCGQPVFVTLPLRADAPRRWALAQERPVTTVSVPDAGLGMARSISAGIAALPDNAVGVMLLLADMPELSSQDLLDMLAEFDGDRILQGSTASGTPGHPVVFPAQDFPALQTLTGDLGAREVLEANRFRLRPVSLPHDHARTDLDTPEDWARWRATQRK